MPSAAENRAPQTGPVIVVIDDDDDSREAVREALNDQGYRTIGATSGQQGLDLLRASRELPRLILLDLTMPVMDGWAFLLNIDRDPDLRQIPVALMSAHPSIRRAFDTDQQKYGFTRLLLPKPLDMKRLLSIIRSVCSVSGTFRKPG